LIFRSINPTHTIKIQPTPKQQGKKSPIESRLAQIKLLVVKEKETEPCSISRENAEEESEGSEERKAK
jgi:hypothetical protein